MPPVYQCGSSDRFILFSADKNEGNRTHRKQDAAANQQHVIPFIAVQPQLHFRRIGNDELQRIVGGVGEPQREILRGSWEEAAGRDGLDQTILARRQAADIGPCDAP